MPPVITLPDAYLEISGVPLATPAWRITDLSALRSRAGVRGDNLSVPYHDGRAIATRRWLDSERLVFPIIVYGQHDQEGNEHPDMAQGLQTNLDYLKQQILRPPHNVADGTRTLRLHLPDGTIRTAPATILGLDAEVSGPAGALGTLELEIPGAVLRDEAPQSETSAVIADATTGTMTVPNPGTANQYELAITLSGTASSKVRLISNTWDPTDGTFLDFNGDVSVGDVDIDTGEFTAVRAAVNVIGLIDHSGHERWLPLVPGDNTIKIQPTGGNVQVTIEHFAAYGDG